MLQTARAKRLLFLWLFSLLPFALSSVQIESITIEGLKRTKRETLLSIIDVRPGDDVTPRLEEEVEQRLRKAGLFQEDITVDLYAGREGQILSITAYDRWTLVGMPFFAVSSGDLRGGAFLMESNLAGRGNMLVSSLMVSQGGDALVFFLYNDPTAFDTEYSARGMISGGRTAVTYTSLDGEEEWERFNTDYFTLGGGTGFDLTDDVNFTLSFSGGFRRDSENGIEPPTAGEDLYDLSLEGQLKYDGLTLFSLFQKGFTADLKGGSRWEPIAGEFFSLLSCKGQYSWAVDSLLLVQITGKGGLASDSFQTLYRLGGSVGSLTLPSGEIASDRYVNGELKGELRLVKMGAGYLTAPFFYEAGYLRDYRDEDQFYQGLGGGIRFYLDKVAIPALGLDYRYNMTTEVGGVSFFMGMSY